MPEETEPTTETVAEETAEQNSAENVENPPESAPGSDETPENPAETTEEQPVENSAAAPVTTTAEQPKGIDVDAEHDAIDALNEKLASGEIDYADHAKAVAKHNRNITKAQRELSQAAQEPYKQQAAAKAYWSNWGKGKDVANVQFGRTVPQSRAQQLYRDVAAKIAANPRYNRPEYQNDPARLQAIIDDRWLDALGDEAKKPKTAAPAKTATTATRTTGATGTSAPASNPNKTAKQRLADGEYNLAGDAQRMGMT